MCSCGMGGGRGLCGVDICRERSPAPVWEELLTAVELLVKNG